MYKGRVKLTFVPKLIGGQQEILASSFLIGRVLDRAELRRWSKASADFVIGQISSGSTKKYAMWMGITEVLYLCANVLQVRDSSKMF